METQSIEITETEARLIAETLESLLDSSDSTEAGEIAKAPELRSIISKLQCWLPDEEGRLRAQCIGIPSDMIEQTKQAADTARYFAGLSWEENTQEISEIYKTQAVLFDNLQKTMERVNELEKMLKGYTNHAYPAGTEED